MILFLSRSFLQRLHLIWKPQLQAFVFGERNFYFFTPDAAVEAQDLSAERIDSFLRTHATLLGFLSPEADQVPFLPGYLQIRTGGVFDPKQWGATIALLEGDEIVSRGVELRAGDNDECR